MNLIRFANLTVFCIALTATSISYAQSLTVERVVSTLSNPTFATHAPGDADRLYITQRTGAIRILNLNTDNLNGANFITVPNVNTSFEGGLLGLAFHPNFEENNFFYVNYTISVGGSFRTRISRFTASSSDTASSATEQVIIEVNQPQQNHNAGWIGFSPLDNFLYVTMGDGGNGNDTGTGHTANIGNGQDFSANLLGSMLRLDVDGDDFPTDPLRNYSIPSDNPFVGITGDDEIYLYGLRNPFRCSFNQANGDLYIADVGQNAREEINVIPGDYDGGLINLGWRFREGTITTPGVGTAQPSNGLNPIYDYLHNGGGFGGFSVSGGVVYRGPVAGLQGSYFFADFVTDNMWSLVYDDSDPSQFNGTNFSDLVQWTELVTVTGGGDLDNIVGFGEDLVGNVYIIDLTDGDLFRIVDGNISNPPENGIVNFAIPFIGTVESGTAPNLNDSDDVAMTFRNAHRALDEPALRVEFAGAVPSGTPSELILNIEARSSTPNVTQTVELFNFDTSVFDVVDNRSAATSDTAFSVEIDSPNPYVVNTSGSVRARITLSTNGPVIGEPWALIVDQFQLQSVE